MKAIKNILYAIVTFHIVLVIVIYAWFWDRFHPSAYTATFEQARKKLNRHARSHRFVALLTGVVK